MLSKLQVCYPRYDSCQSDPFEGLRTGALNCLGATIASCALSERLVPLRYTLSTIDPETRIRTKSNNGLFMALDPDNETVISSLAGVKAIDEIGIDHFASLDGKFAYPLTVKRILRLIAQDPTSIPRYEIRGFGDREPVLRVVQIDPERAIQSISNIGNLRDLRCEIETQLARTPAIA